MLSPFAHVFNTNYAPSKEEIEGIRSIIHDPQEEIRKLEQEILTLQARRDELQLFVDRHCALLSPFRRLPGDLWGEIFIRCLPNDHFPVRSVSEAPLLLTTICRSWREIALATPRLWSSIHIFLPHPHAEECTGEAFTSLIEAREEGVKLWFARSGALPLKVSLTMHNIPSGWRVPHVISDATTQNLHREFMQFIIGYSRRWTFLSLSYIPEAIMTPFHALTSGDLPLLAGFHEEGILANLMPLGQSFDVQNPPPLLFFDAVGTSPALRHLHISVTGRFDSLQKSRSHWAFLTKLEIEVDRPTLGCVSSMQGLSRSCPLLRELTITRLYNPIQLDETVVEVSEWIHLREFTLILVRQPAPTFMSSLFNIFESFTAPSLTDLSLAVKPFGSRWDDESFDYEADLPFHNFIIRSQCQLNSLRLDMPFGENSLRKTLDLLSSLTSFTVDITHSPHYLHVPTTSNHLDGIVRALSPSTEFVVCPALKNLYITSCRPEDAVVLVNLIEARAMHNTKLETLRAKFWSLSRASVRVLNSALELGKSKGLGVKIEWEYRKEAFEFDDPHIYSSHPTHEVLVG